MQKREIKTYLREGGVFPVNLVLALVVRVRRTGHDEACSGDLLSDSCRDTKRRQTTSGRRVRNGVKECQFLEDRWRLQTVKQDGRTRKANRLCVLQYVDKT